MNTGTETNPPVERWLSKRELAAHYGYTTRWVEQQQTIGLPSRLIGGRRRYRLSEVDAWLAQADSSVA